MDTVRLKAHDLLSLKVTLPVAVAGLWVTDQLWLGVSLGLGVGRLGVQVDQVRLGTVGVGRVRVTVREGVPVLVKVWKRERGSLAA